jgi:malate dehydrogenase (oxaloacetate-decarboxylating)
LLRISSPKCFYILDILSKECSIPVWHDDQQGTYTVVLAGVINALKLVDKELSDIKITCLGAGGAGLPVANKLLRAGAKGNNMIVTDMWGILNPETQNLNENQVELANKTNPKKLKGDAADAVRGADLLIAFTGKVGFITQDMVKSMAKNPVVFAMSNPMPEIWPWEAKEAGAKVIATGRSDFPNQVNNSLGFPAIFRGVLDVQAKSITDGMCTAAAEELAKCAEDRGIDEDNILPTMGEWEVFVREAVAVGMKAQEEGVARLKLSRDELYKRAEYTIKSSREMTALLMKEGYIAPAPE